LNAIQEKLPRYWPRNWGKAGGPFNYGLEERQMNYKIWEHDINKEQLHTKGPWGETGTTTGDLFPDYLGVFRRENRK